MHIGKFLRYRRALWVAFTLVVKIAVHQAPLNYVASQGPHVFTFEKLISNTRATTNAAAGQAVFFAQRDKVGVVIGTLRARHMTPHGDLAALAIGLVAQTKHASHLLFHI